MKFESNLTKGNLNKTGNNFTTILHVLCRRSFVTASYQQELQLNIENITTVFVQAALGGRKLTSLKVCCDEITGHMTLF